MNDSAEKLALRKARFSAVPPGNRYMQLKGKRDDLRKKYVQENKIQDASNPRPLSEAITLVGECEDMCPEFERHEREYQKLVDKLELVPGTSRIDHSRAVKAYHRSAAGRMEELPCDIRPPAVLKQTMDYLIDNIMATRPLRECHYFIRDRVRSIQKDFFVQHYTGKENVDVSERTARFHILSAHFMCEESAFSMQQENELWCKVLVSLLQIYEDDRAKGKVHANEGEFCAYHLLSHPTDATVEAKIDVLPPDVLRSPYMVVARAIHNVYKEARDVYTKSSKNLAAALEVGARIFRCLINVHVPFLVLCAVEPYFADIRKATFRAISVAVEAGDKELVTVDVLKKVLAYDSDEQVIEDLKANEIGIENGVVKFPAERSAALWQLGSTNIFRQTRFVNERKGFALLKEIVDGTVVYQGLEEAGRLTNESLSRPLDPSFLVSALAEPMDLSFLNVPVPAPGPLKHPPSLVPAGVPNGPDSASMFSRPLFNPPTVPQFNGFAFPVAQGFPAGFSTGVASIGLSTLPGVVPVHPAAAPSAAAAIPILGGTPTVSFASQPAAAIPPILPSAFGMPVQRVATFASSRTATGIFAGNVGPAFTTSPPQIPVFAAQSPTTTTHLSGRFTSLAQLVPAPTLPKSPGLTRSPTKTFPAKMTDSENMLRDDASERTIDDFTAPALGLSVAGSTNGASPSGSDKLVSPVNSSPSSFQRSGSPSPPTPSIAPPPPAKQTPPPFAAVPGTTFGVQCPVRETEMEPLDEWEALKEELGRNNVEAQVGWRGRALEILDGLSAEAVPAIVPLGFKTGVRAKAERRAEAKKSREPSSCTPKRPRREDGHKKAIAQTQAALPPETFTHTGRVLVKRRGNVSATPEVDNTLKLTAAATPAVPDQLPGSWVGPPPEVWATPRSVTVKGSTKKRRAVAAEDANKDLEEEGRLTRDRGAGTADGGESFYKNVWEIIAWAARYAEQIRGALPEGFPLELLRRYTAYPPLDH